MDRNSGTPSSSNQDEISLLPLQPQNAGIKGHNKDLQVSKLPNPHNIMGSANMALAVQHVPPIGHRPPRALPEPRMDTVKDPRFVERCQVVPLATSRELHLDVEDLDIPWSDLVLKERIGAGNSFMLIKVTLLNVDICIREVMPVSKSLSRCLFSPE